MKRITTFFKLVFLFILGLSFNQISFAQCGPGQSSIDITIDFTNDIYPDEDAWIIVNTNTGAVVDSVCFNEYGATTGIEVETVCLDTGITYTLYALDDFGDGLDNAEYRLAFSFGNGIDTIGVNNLNIVRPHCNASYSNNEIEDSTSFYVPYVAPPSCSSPNLLVVTNITTTSVDLNWRENNSATQWQIQYDTAGFVLGTGIDSIVNSKPKTLSSLASGTLYDFYVRSICGVGDTSSWSSGFTFLTACTAISTFPYFEGFEVLPNNCLRLEQVSGSAVWSAQNGNQNSSVSAYAGNANAYFYSANYNGDASRLILPPFDLTSLTAPRLSFWYTQVAWGTDQDTLGVYYKTSFSGPWIYLTSFNSNTTSWTNEIISLPNPSADYYIAFEGYSGWGRGVTLDNIIVEETPIICTDPISLFTTSVTSDSAQLNWTETGTATEWIVEWDTAGFTAGMGANSIVVNTDTFVTITGLSSGTIYDFYVRSICGIGDTSSWSSGFTFLTACTAISTFPYFEGFEVLPINCLTLEQIRGSATWSGQNGNQNSSVIAYAGNANAYFFSGNYNGDASRLILPPFDLTSLTSPRLSFWHTQVAWGTDQDTLGVYYKTSFSGPWIYLTSFNSNTTSWTNEIISLPNPSTDYYIAFEGYSGWGRGVTLDNILVDGAPSCLDPTSLSVDSVTSGSAQLTWSETGTATEWIVEWDTTGYTAGMGANSIVVNTDTFITITGLSSGSLYDFYVRSICGVGDTSSWSLGLSFLTNCSAISSFPYFEGFEVLTASNCLRTQPIRGSAVWSGQNGNQNSSVSAYAGNANAYFFSGNYNGDASRLILPPFDLTSLTTPRLNFWYTQVAWGTDQDTLGVYYKTSFSGPWIYLTSFNSNTTSWTNEIISLPNPSADYYIAFEGYSGYGRGVTLDNIIVEETPIICAIPSQLTFDSLSSTTTRLSWLENDTSTQWIIEYDTTGFTPGMGANSTVVNTDTFTTIFGLSPATRYDFYVRAICSIGDTSSYSTVLSITTPCVSITTFPFSENFDTLGSTACWSLDILSGSAVWALLNGNQNSSVNARSGNFNAYYYSGNYNGDASRLITPPMDLTSLSSPRLNFWYTQVAWGSDQDTLGVYYRTSRTGSWTYLTSFSANTTTWTNEIIDLPNPSENYYIAFEGYSGYGRGVTLDDVVIEDTPPCFSPTSLDVDSITASSALLKWSEMGTASQWLIQYDTSGFMTGMGRNSIIVNTDTFINISGLKPTTFYDFNVRAICGPNDTSLYSNSATFMTDLQYYPIGTINGENSTGVADSLNVNCVISGTVTGFDRFAVGHQFALIDLSSGVQEGITVGTWPSISGFNPTEGDSLKVYGSVFQVFGLTQFLIDSVNVITSGTATVPTPIQVAALDENTESKLIELNDNFVLLNPSGSLSYSMEATNGIDTITILVDSLTDIDDSLNVMTNGLVAGDTICGLIGIGAQLDSVSPFNEGYRVFPSRYSDLTICRLTVGIKDVETNKASFTISPNPTSGEFTLRTSGFKNESVRIFIRDISGRVISDEILTNATNKINKTMNLSENAKGLYFINIFDGEEVIHQKLILR